MNTPQYELAYLSIAVLSLFWVIRGLLAKKYSFYWFMLWNIFLAAVPALVLIVVDRFGGGNFLLDSLMFLIWLLFLPNIFYLLTDYMHLNPLVLVNQRKDGVKLGTSYVRGDAWFILDSLLLFLTTLYALLIGGYSIDGMYRFVLGNYEPITQFVIGLALVASAIGLYIGRYARWNSWDVFTRPHKVLGDFLKSLKTEKERKRLVIVFVTITIFQLISWASYLYIS